MPIALPAPATPELGTVEIVRAQGSEYASAAVQQNQVHVFGPNVVSKETVEQAITGSENLSDAVRRIQAVYYLAGYPAVRVVYALAEPDLYVSVSLGKVTKVEAPAPYDAYFDGLTGADPLTDDALEPGRTFASLHADRAGQSANPVFIPDGDGSVLRIEPNDKGPGRSSMGLGFGNPGNRFVGRHFLDWFAKTSFTTGDELRASGRYGMEGLDHDQPTSDGYNEHTLSWGKVTPWGLFAVQGRYVGYQQVVEGGLDPQTGNLVGNLRDAVLGLIGLPPTPGAAPGTLKLSGNIREAEAGWTGLLHSSFYSRWGVGAKIDYTYKDFAVTMSDQTLQRQEYASAELSTQYSYILNLLDLPTELSAGVAVRSGLGDNKTDKPITAADLGYLLFRPTASIKSNVSEWLALRLMLFAQITDDTLPEQQQWVVGGLGNIESYLPGVASGDSGGVARFQFEFKSYDVATVKFAPTLFAEYGYSKYENPFDGQDGATQSLADGGVSLAMSRGPFEASVSYAESFHEKNVAKDVLHDSDANMFFRLAMKF